MNTPTTDIATLLTTAQVMDRKRRITAVNEFPQYRVVGVGQVMKLATGEVHTVGMDGTCTCKDSACTLAPIRAKLKAAGVECTLRCKHHTIGRLLTGRPVQVDNSRFTAAKK